jgi:hypothetical protein
MRRIPTFGAEFPRMIPHFQAPGSQPDLQFAARYSSPTISLNNSCIFLFAACSACLLLGVAAH